MLRWLPFVASFWCAPVIILSLHTLLAGFNNDSLEGAAIITVSSGIARLLNASNQLFTVQYLITAPFRLLSIQLLSPNKCHQSHTSLCNKPNIDHSIPGNQGLVLNSLS